MKISLVIILHKYVCLNMQCTNKNTILIIIIIVFNYGDIRGVARPGVMVGPLGDHYFVATWIKAISHAIRQ